MMKNLLSKNQVLYLAPRILAVLFVLFLMMFSLDVFQPGLSLQAVITGLFIHNIPALALLTLLIISWKHEIFGGIVFILAGLCYIILVLSSKNFELYMLTWSLFISGPAFIIGTLFLINWFKKTKR